MLKKNKEMVMYTSPSEVIIGPLSTEVHLIENCFTLAGRKLKDFKREVHPMRDMGDMLKIANEVISASRKETPQ
jgi:hypothetical protein|tara:strand:+ start:1969 stop:2190 length:222 start_codon:yes stop_codon:yes gene_type:complete